jgi:hypothetical protein
MAAIEARPSRRTIIASPIANRQSPIVNRQSSIVNRQRFRIIHALKFKPESGIQFPIFALDGWEGTAMRTLTTEYTLTPHALRRMSQRNVTYEDVLFAIRHGKVEYRAGAILFFLGKRRIPSKTSNAEHLEGIAVLCKGRAIITVYRNRRSGLKDHRRKTKYDRDEILQRKKASRNPQKFERGAFTSEAEEECEP